MSKPSRPARPKSGIPKPSINSAHKRRSAPPDGFINNLDAVFQKQTDDDKYLTKRCILQARKTGTLSLSGKGIAAVPDRVWRLEEAEEELKKIDQTFLKSELDEGREEEESDVRWWEKKPLNTLNLSNNHINSIPSEINKLICLTSLDLHENNLSSLPDEFGSLGQLEILDISHNKISELPNSFYNLGELKALTLSHNKLKILSEDLGNLYRLETLDISSNELTSMPLGVGFLSALTKLDASNNHLIEVPPELAGLLGLTQLNLSHNELCKVPPLNELRKLQQLHLQDNCLEEMPGITMCSSLRELHLAANRIQVIPVEMLQSMGHLRVLNLRDNKIQEIPEDISNLQSLVRLDIANNNIEDIPPCIGFLPQLQLLALEGNPLKKIRQDMLHCGSTRLLRMMRGTGDPSQQSPGASPGPRVKLNLPRSEKPPLPDIYRMRGNRALSLGMQGLSEIPESLFLDAQAAEVETVDLCKNHLTAVPSRIPLLAASLTELNLSDNRLTEIAVGILGTCQKLHYIDLQQNALSSLPMDIKDLVHLREINISYNKFTELPAELQGLPGLEILNVRDNKISIIDAELLGSLPRLTVLDLTNNDINQVPPELGLLYRLRSLCLEGNTFRIPRREILERGTACVLNYLRDRIPAGSRGLSSLGPTGGLGQGTGAGSVARGCPPDPPRQNSYTSHIVF